jgi:predicted dehydrogenase
VLPALLSLGATSIDVASSSAEVVEVGNAVAVHLFRDYDEALRQTDAQVVYVSTVNSLHAYWTRKALQQGFHVAVDKPAFLSVEETRELIELADRNHLCLAEATVYSYHPQIASALAAFEQTRSTPTHLLAVFSFPPLDADNFRYRVELGGGALWDLGPYAVTPGRLIFGDQPIELIGRRLSSRGRVDTGFGFMAMYAGGRCCVGSFGYTAGYLNRLDIIGPGTVVTIDRVFSPPANVDLELTIRQSEHVRTVRVPAADSFALFLEDFFDAIVRDHRRFVECMLVDALALERLRSSVLMDQ